MTPIAIKIFDLLFRDAYTPSKILTLPRETVTPKRRAAELVFKKTDNGNILLTLNIRDLFDSVVIIPEKQGRKTVNRVHTSKRTHEVASLTVTLNYLNNPEAPLDRIMDQEVADLIASGATIPDYTLRVAYLLALKYILSPDWKELKTHFPDMDFRLKSQRTEDDHEA